MRTTQYIGLTATAAKAMAAFEPIRSYKGSLYAEEVKPYVTIGMFGEEIPLGMWMDDLGNVYREVLQASPWSSGPMLFTCIEVNGILPEKWKWMEDLLLTTETVDKLNGRYFV
jgi:hypothetical protein